MKNEVGSEPRTAIPHIQLAVADQRDDCCRAHQRRIVYLQSDKTQCGQQRLMNCLMLLWGFHVAGVICSADSYLPRVQPKNLDCSSITHATVCQSKQLQLKEKRTLPNSSSVFRNALVKALSKWLTSHASERDTLSRCASSTSMSITSEPVFASARILCFTAEFTATQRAAAGIDNHPHEAATLSFAFCWWHCATQSGCSIRTPNMDSALPF